MSIGAKPATCETCPFFSPYSEAIGDYKAGEHGVCRRFPRAATLFVFGMSKSVERDIALPHVLAAVDWCAEHPGRTLLPDLIANAIERTSLDIERRAR